MSKALLALGVAAVAVAVAVVLGSGPHSSVSRATPAATATAALRSPSSGSAAPSATPSPSSDSIADARAFVESYLPYLYGRAEIGTVVHVEPALRAGLASTRQEISAAERERSVSVTTVDVAPRDSATVAVTALVSEGDPASGVATYPIRFQMRHDVSAGWLVSTVPTLG